MSSRAIAASSRRWRPRASIAAANRSSTSRPGSRAIRHIDSTKDMSPT
jgi:hypothetical protein